MPLQPSENGPPNEAIYSALGRLVYAFAEVEDALLHAIIAALGETDEAEIVVVGMNFRQALDRFSILYEPVSSGDVGPLCVALDKLNDERNRHIHSTWGFWLSGAPARAKKKVQRSKGMSFILEAVDPEEVVRLASRMIDVAKAIYELRDRYVTSRRGRPPWGEIGAPRANDR